MNASQRSNCNAERARKPCSSCPWRIDQDASAIPGFNLRKAERLAATCPNERGFGPDFGAPWFACHHSRDGSVCKRNGDPRQVADLLLSDAELGRLTGYKRPAEQLDELRRLGFHRARRSRLGGVILERAHYLAVCAGAIEQAAPKVRPPRVRAVA